MIIFLYLLRIDKEIYKNSTVLRAVYCAVKTKFEIFLLILYNVSVERDVYMANYIKNQINLKEGTVYDEWKITESELEI